MKKIAITLMTMTFAFNASAEILSRLLTSGESGLSKVASHFATELQLPAQGQKQLYETLENVLTALHGGSLPRSSQALAPQLLKFKTNVLDVDLTKVSASRFIEMVNSASDDASKLGLQGQNTFLKCDYCMNPRLREEGLSGILSKAAVTKGAQDYLTPAKIEQGLRTVGAKLNFSSRDMDGISKTFVNFNEKTQLITAIGAMTEGTVNQLEFGKVFKSLPLDVKRTLMTDTRIWLAVIEEQGSDSMVLWKDILGEVAATKPKNSQEFMGKMQKMFQDRLGKNSDEMQSLVEQNCWGIAGLLK